MKEYIIYNVFGLYALINMQDITIQQAVESVKNGVYPVGYHRE